MYRTVITQTGVAPDMNRVLQWLLALVMGIVAGGGTFVWLVDYPTLAVALALVYTVLTWLGIEFGPTLPGESNGYNWRTARWHSSFAGVIALIGILVTIPGSFKLGIALLLLVTGVGWMGLFFGVATAREQAAADESTGKSEAVNEPERSDHPGANTERA